MQKNWYIIYTRPKCEKRLVFLLTKKKIENFFPQYWRETTSFGKRKLYQETLFKSYVFALVTECEVEKLKAINGVVNLLYWKGRAAVIDQREIGIIKEFIVNYQNIQVEKIAVNVKDGTRICDGSKYSFYGNVLTIKNTMAKVNLPSLGFSLVAKIERTDSFQSTAAFYEKSLLLPS